MPTKNGGFAKSKIVAKTDSAAVGSRVFSFLFENVHEHGNENDDRKNDSGSPIDHRGLDVLPAYPVSIVFNEWVGEISFAELLLHLPLPVGDGTITPAKPKAEHKPWESRCHDRHEVSFSRLLPDPPEEIECNKSEMHQCEKNVKKLEH